MINNTAQFGGSMGPPLEGTVRSTVTFADVPADSQAIKALQSRCSQQKATYSVTVAHEGVLAQPPTMFKNFEVPIDASGDVYLLPILQMVSSFDAEMEGSAVFYWSEQERTYIFVGKYPAISDNYQIPVAELNAQNLIKIKLRNQGQMSNQRARAPVNRLGSLTPDDGRRTMCDTPAIGQPAYHQAAQQSGNGEEQKHPAGSSISTRSKRIVKDNKAKSGSKQPQEINNEDSNEGGKDKGKRTKERSIEEIIQKVSLWRRLYNGVLRDGNLYRYSLEDAATKVNVSKKSLDDYLLQLRFGKKYNFDFQKHKDDKVGVLRAYVKQKKAEDKKKAEDMKQRPGQEKK